MRILVFGAGVLGSLYAARLKQAGQEVTILARGARAEEIRQHGIVLEDETTGTRTETRLPVISELAVDDCYDVILVLVRRDQIDSTLPQLAANRSPSVVFMANNASGPSGLVDALGEGRVLLGFAGAGGAREGHVVRCRVVSAQTQPTTLGELSGQVTPRLEAITAALQQAGFPTAFSANIDAWLKTHAVGVVPIAGAMYFAGDNYKLAASKDGLYLMIRAFREGVRALMALGIPVEPAKFKVLRWIPAWFLAILLRRIFATKRAELVMWRHAAHARGEMELLADDVRALMRRAGRPTPAFDRLFPEVKR
ncbi:MAG TPA: 2-dehydropantoate 2-reductase N-terminal domain-containing protein [Symbiobacteriaceae bacterium]|nr:2-dehydropantoate 2-reductase N-terminal domain-containing protein [Symbiobacteriaceae bacterium]